MKASSLFSSKTFSSSPKETSHPLKWFPIPTPMPQLQSLPPLICFLSLWLCLFWILHVNGTMQYVTLCVWLLSLSTMFSGFIHVCSTDPYPIPFHCWMIFHCMDRPRFMYLFIYWYTFGLLPPFGYHEWYCYEDSCQVSKHKFSILLCIYT